MEEIGSQEEEVIMLCRSGNRSGTAQKLLTQMGYTKVINLQGGMLAWQEAFNG